MTWQGNHPAVRGRWAGVAGLAVVIGLTIAFAPGHRGWFDVGVYYGAVNFWVHEHGDIYNYVRPESVYGFTYPPFAALLMLPMAAVQWHAAIAINFALSAAASAFLLYLLVDPLARRFGWDRWFALALAVCVFAGLGPVRDTFSFGQINLVLMALVYLDLRKHPLAGVGIGLATAIKLTPGVFIVYLLVTGRWRMAATAVGTAVSATLLAGVVMPDATRAYFTELLWETNRVGNLDYVSNQSLLGMLARWNTTDPNHLLWVLLVAVTLLIWLRKVRDSDLRTGFALTGLVGCLISPITWVHHLVWLIPGFVLLLERRRVHHAATVGYLLLCSGLIWLWTGRYEGLSGFLGSNMYVLVAIWLLFALSARQSEPALVYPLQHAPANARYLAARIRLAAAHDQRWC